MTPPVLLTVNPALLTYTANAANRIYGSANPALTGSVTGFVNEQGIGEGVTTGTAAFIASPGISGASGNQVIFAGDLAGTEHAYSLATGTQVFAYKAAATIFASSAIVNGMVFFAGLDGYVYALG